MNLLFFAVKKSMRPFWNKWNQLNKMHALIPLETRIIPKMSSKTVCESIHIKTHSETQTFLYNWNITLNHWFICKVNNRCSFCKCLWLICMICLPIFFAFLSFITTLLDFASRLTIMTSYRADLFYTAMLFIFVYVVEFI